MIRKLYVPAFLLMMLSADASLAGSADGTSRQSAQIEYEQGRRLLINRDALGALSLLEKATALRPADSRYWYFRAFAEHALGRLSSRARSLRIASIIRAAKPTAETAIVKDLIIVRGSIRSDIEEQLARIRSEINAGISAKELLAAALRLPTDATSLVAMQSRLSQSDFVNLEPYLVGQKETQGISPEQLREFRGATRNGSTEDPSAWAKRLVEGLAFSGGMLTWTIEVCKDDVAVAEASLVPKAIVAEWLQAYGDQEVYDLIKGTGSNSELSNFSVNFLSKDCGTQPEPPVVIPPAVIENTPSYVEVETVEYVEVIEYESIFEESTSYVPEYYYIRVPARRRCRPSRSYLACRCVPKTVLNRSEVAVTKLVPTISRKLVPSATPAYSGVLTSGKDPTEENNSGRVHVHHDLVKEGSQSRIWESKEGKQSKCKLELVDVIENVCIFQKEDGKFMATLVARLCVDDRNIVRNYVTSSARSRTFRSYRDSTGNHQADLALITTKSEWCLLARRDGRLISVKIDRLGDKEKAFVLSNPRSSGGRLVANLSRKGARAIKVEME